MCGKRLAIGHHGLHIGTLPLRLFEAGAPDTQQKVFDALRRLGHARLEDILSVGLVAEQLGALRTQLGSPDQQRAIVDVALGSAQAIAIEQLLAQLAVLGLDHERLVGRAVQSDDPGLLLFVPDGSFEIVAEAGHFFVGPELEREPFRRGKQVLCKLRRQCGQFAVQLGNLCLDLW